jgi:hypothetical protein
MVGIESFILSKDYRGSLVLKIKKICVFSVKLMLCSGSTTILSSRIGIQVSFFWGEKREINFFIITFSIKYISPLSQ